MFCRNCGQQIDDKAAVCIHCGRSTKSTPPAAKDAPSAAMAFLGFFVPMAGLIIWAVCHDSQPLMAKSAGKGALIGFIASIVGTILVYVAYFALFFMIGMM